MIATRITPLVLLVFLAGCMDIELGPCAKAGGEWVSQPPHTYVNETAMVDAGGHWSKAFVAERSSSPMGDTPHTRLYFHAQGGPRNDTVIRILDHTGYENWRNGNTPGERQAYASPQLTTESTWFMLWGRHYVFVVDNTFDVDHAKTVTVQLSHGGFAECVQK